MKTKWVLRNYQYMECDAFAAYLHEMSAQGWHFTKWGLGLVFTKGEPADICYAVEVFPNGSDMDAAPCPEAEEFAEYCEAAGWKFIDGRQKFCIFRQMTKPVTPIVTPKERFENIRKAQLRQQTENLLSRGLAAFLFLLQALGYAFESWMFHTILLLCLCLLTAEFAWTFFGNPCHTLLVSPVPKTSGSGNPAPL